MPQPQHIQAFYDVINSRDMEKFLSYFADDAQFKSVASNEIYKGKKELREMAEEWMTAFPDGKFQVQKIIGNGNDWSVEMAFVGTHQGPLNAGPMGDLPASGKKVNVPACDVITLKNDKIQSVNCYLAVTVMLEQIGAMPTRKAA